MLLRIRVNLLTFSLFFGFLCLFFALFSGTLILPTLFHVALFIYFYFKKKEQRE
jgi:hypothetical protein